MKRNFRGSNKVLQPPKAECVERVSKDLSFDLRKLRPVEVLFLVRYFLTKKIERRKQLENFEEIFLYLGIDFILIQKDPQFIQKHHKLIMILRIIAQDLSNLNESFVQSRIKIFRKNSNLFVSPRAFLGKETIKENNLLYRRNRKLEDLFPPKPANRIGVGYRDSATARNLALDGSPSWQEAFRGLSAVNKEKALSIHLTVRSGSTTIILDKSVMLSL